jgi:hypothetical protein
MSVKHRVNFDTTESLYRSFFYVSKIKLGKTMTELFNEFMQNTVKQYEQDIKGKIA